MLAITGSQMDLVSKIFALKTSKNSMVNMDMQIIPWKYYRMKMACVNCDCSNVKEKEIPMENLERKSSDKNRIKYVIYVVNNT